GPPAESQTAAATTALSASNASAMPSRRCPCSISPARLSVRVVAPTPRASMVQPPLTVRLSTANGAVSERPRAGLLAWAARARGGVLGRGGAARPALAARGVAPARGARDRAAVVLPRADPARARLVVVLRDLPAMSPG